MAALYASTRRSAAPPAVLLSIAEPVSRDRCSVSIRLPRGRVRTPCAFGLAPPVAFRLRPVDTLRLRPMTDTEFAAFRARSVHGYAVEKVAAGEWSKERADELAEEQTRSLLPDGRSTDGMFIVMVE